MESPFQNTRGALKVLPKNQGPKGGGRRNAGRPGEDLAEVEPRFIIDDEVASWAGSLSQMSTGLMPFLASPFVRPVSAEAGPLGRPFPVRHEASSSALALVVHGGLVHVGHGHAVALVVVGDGVLHGDGGERGGARDGGGSGTDHGRAGHRDTSWWFGKVGSATQTDTSGQLSFALRDWSPLQLNPFFVHGWRAIA